MAALELVKSFLEHILTPHRHVIIIGILLVILGPVFLHVYLSRTVSYITLPSVLLVGPTGAGKTTLLTLFERRSSPSATHTSQIPSSIELAVSEDGASSYRDDLDELSATAKKFLLVDTPGHGKLRHFAMSRLGQASTLAHKLHGLVFVVDAGALADHDALASAASYLYDILLALQKRMGSGKSAKAPATIPVLIAANKLDLFTALPAALVKSQLETELGRIRLTRSKGLLDSGVGADDVDDAAENDDWLGEYGSEKFSFAQMREFDIDVEVIGGNITGDGPGVDRWWSWIGDKI